MSKCLVVSITSLTILVFIAGCPPGKPELVKPLKAELPKVESSKVEPNDVAPTKPEPNDVVPPKAEPNEVEPTKAEPNDVAPTKPEPNDVEPPKPEPNEVESPKPKPVTKVAFHNKCTRILKAFVNDKGMVNYKNLKRKRLELKQLLNEFAKLDPNEYNSWPKEDKIAFWINAYNIKMLKIIVDNYPIQSSRIMRLFWPPDSIRHIDKSIGGIKKQKLIVREEEFTLGDIEKQFFGKKFDEPRVFLALSGACLSSPPLRNEPYYGHKLYKQLDDQTKRFLSSPRAFRINRDNQTVYLSAILQPTWYGKEFISKYGTEKKFKDQQSATRAVLNFLINYISKQNVSFLELKNYSIKYITYDWRLNDSSRK